jgi:hypothetical protein
MSTTSTTSTNGRHDTGHRAVGPAIFLWFLVACGLLYGVYMTATKVPALFGG